jgi:hypothetical protein
METIIWIIGGLAIGYFVVKAAMLFFAWLEKKEQ